MKNLNKVSKKKFANVLESVDICFTSIFWKNIASKERSEKLKTNKELPPCLTLDVEGKLSPKITQ